MYNSYSSEADMYNPCSSKGNMYNPYWRGEEKPISFRELIIVLEDNHVEHLSYRYERRDPTRSFRPCVPSQPFFLGIKS
jgi:hypothetical protein